nr:MAG TPA: hypothetical protein [Caudoviricetes sp.]
MKKHDRHSKRICNSHHLWNYRKFYRHGNC